MNLPHTTFKFTLHFARQQWVKFSFIIFASFVWAANDVVFPYFIKEFVNILGAHTGDPSEIYGAVKHVLILLVIFWVSTDLMMRLQGFVQMHTFPKFRASIREAVLKYVNAHSHDYFSQNFAGNLAKKLADLPTSCQAMMEIICYNFLTAGFGTILVLVMMYNTRPLFAGIVLIWLCLHLGLTTIFLHRGHQLWSQHADALSILNGKIVDIFSNIVSVRLFSRGHYELQYLKQFQTIEMQKATKAMRLVEVVRIGLGLSGLFLIFATIFTLLYEWEHQRITLGDFAQVGMQAFWLLGWIWFVTFQMTMFVRETGTISDSLALIRKPHGLVDAQSAQPLVVTAGTISFDQVNFAYNKNKYIFQDLNVIIPGGKKIGLVGFSGSGKSTFVNLLLRFYDVSSGKILIDSQDIANVQQDSLREQIAMIPQDPSLFHRTLMENIRYGHLTATDAEVIHAAKLAHCHEFIEVLDEGYAALVGERGIKLSGGQRQRIAIARAILKNARILILDEATSSLDSVTEKLIQESLQHLMAGKTTLVIAHRLSTLADMDWILVFEQGHIIEQGTKENLLAHSGHFAKLWNMQKNGFLPDH